MWDAKFWASVWEVMFWPLVACVLLPPLLVSLPPAADPWAWARRAGPLGRI